MYTLNNSKATQFKNFVCYHLKVFALFSKKGNLWLAFKLYSITQKTNNNPCHRNADAWLGTIFTNEISTVVLECYCCSRTKKHDTLYVHHWILNGCFSLYKLDDEIGSCEPIWNLYNSMFVDALCRYTVDSLVSTLFQDQQRGGGVRH